MIAADEREARNYQRLAVNDFTILIFSKIVPTEAGPTNGLTSRAGEIYFTWI